MSEENGEIVRRTYSLRGGKMLRMAGVGVLLAVAFLTDGGGDEVQLSSAQTAPKQRARLATSRPMRRRPLATRIQRTGALTSAGQPAKDG